MSFVPWVRPPARLRRDILLLAFAGLTSACADAEPLSDSEAPEWRLAEPVVSVGVLEGEEPYQLQNVRSGWKDGLGRIIIADSGPNALRIFDASGTYLLGFAPRGQGPGEIGIPWNAFPYRGDSIAVFDISARQVSIFDADGTFERRVRIPAQIERAPGTIPSQSCCQLSGVLADGSLVVHPPDAIPNEAGPPRHSSFSLVTVTPDGGRTDTLGTFESARYEYDASAPNNVRRHRLSRSFTYAVGRDVIVGGNGASGTLSVIGPGVDGIDSLSLPIEGRPATRELLEAYMDAYRDEAERRPDFFRETSMDEIERGPWGDRAPAHALLHVDEAGRLWVQRWSLPFETEPQILDIFSREGARLGWFGLPERSRILWIGEDEVLLLDRDELDVETVRLYPLDMGVD